MSHQVQSKSLVKTIHWYEHTAKKKYKKLFKKRFFKLLNNAVFGKTMKTITIEARRSCFQSEPNYDTTKTFFSRFFCIRNEKNKTKQNKKKQRSSWINLSI